MATSNRPTNRRIELKINSEARHDEAVAVAIIYPGMLPMLDADGKAKPHDLTKSLMRAVVKENALFGKTIDDAYAVGDSVQYVFPLAGDEVVLRLRPQENVTKYDGLMPDGAGRVVKVPAGGQELINNLASSEPITNTIAETTFSNGTLAVGPNTFSAGNVVKVHAVARVVDQNSTDTATVRLKLGATTLLTVPATDVADGDLVTIDGTLIIRSVGATGKLVGDFEYTIGVGGTATRRSTILSEQTIDFTAGPDMTITNQWSVAHADNQIVLDQFTVTVPNAAGESLPVFQALESVDLSAGLSTDDAFIKARVLA